MPTYRPIDDKPDHPGLEHRILELWEREGTFATLRAQIAGGEPFSFTDGPITANNPMGVHHAWGRSLKDLFQRYKAMQGFDLRYQNGFDCQGLWVEVEVEKALGLNSKREIEEYGLDRFARACRDRVAEYSAVQTEQSKRLGMWMDWDRSYFTMTDPNIDYIWRFLHECHERGWLYIGQRPMVWCPRCGTSLSQHELIDSYREVEHPSLYVRFPLSDATGEAIVIWTTTPWTLAVNGAAVVDPEAEYAAVEVEDGVEWVASALVDVVYGPGARVARRTAGRDLVGRPYSGPYGHLAPHGDWQPRVLAAEMVSLDEGTGIVHIAAGAGAEDYEIGQREGLPVIVPIDESGVFVDGFDFLTGHDTVATRDLIRDDLDRRGLLLRAQPIHHRYPVCWRCQTELVFRVVDEWFISAEGVREPMIEAARTVRWVPDHYGKRMEDWLRNMGDWCISRKRYWGLPLPFYRAPSGKVTVVRSLAELRERAVDPAAVDALPELHRPWIDTIEIRTDDGEVATRVTEVGDCWLDAGIVPFSTLGYGRSEVEAEGYARGAGVGLTRADLPDHAYWERWFPADWVSEMREQIRLWFYSQLFMSVVLVGRAPYRSVLGYEKLHDETGRAMHKSWGNAIWFDDAVEKMGADVMRWLYAAQTPSQNMNFGYGPATEVKRRLLTLWNSYRFFRTYAAIDDFAPAARDLERGPAVATELDRWLVARVQATIAEARTALDDYWTPAYVRSVEALIDDLSNWYIRGSRARFWKSEDDADKHAAFSTLWYGLVQVTRLIAPAMPFLAEELWQTLVRDVATGAPTSVHLAGFPIADEALADADRVAGVADAQTVIRLGRAARAQAGPPVSKLRQPLAEAVVAAPRSCLAGLAANTDLVARELNVKQVRLIEDPTEIVEVALVPNFRALGPRLGKDLPDVKRRLASGDFTRDGDNLHVGQHVLGADDYEERVTARPGLAAAHEGAFAVGIDATLTDALIDEGVAKDLTHHLQELRKRAGLEVSDRVVLAASGNDAAERVLATHGASIAAEILATAIEPCSDGEGIALGAAEFVVSLRRA